MSEMTKNSSGFCAKYPEIKFKEIYWKEADISVRIPSLTVGRQKSGYKPSKYGRCSRFLSCIDMCYISVLFTTFVFLIIVRIEVFVVIS